MINAANFNHFKMTYRIQIGILNMSALESMIWTVLGYLAMPAIFIFGFVGVAAVSLVILKMLNKQPSKQEQEY